MEHVGLADAARRAGWAFAVGTSIYPEYGWPLAAPTLGAAARSAALVLLARRRGGELLMLAGWAVGPAARGLAFGALTGRASFHERYVSLGRPALLALAAVGIVDFGLARRQTGAPPDLGRAGSARPSRQRAGRAAGGAVGWRGARPGRVGTARRGAGRRRSALAWEFGDPHFAKENVRAAAAFVAPAGQAGDALIGGAGPLGLYDRYRARRDAEARDRRRLGRRAGSSRRARREGHRRPATDLDAAGRRGRRARRRAVARRARLPARRRWFGLAPVMSWCPGRRSTRARAARPGSARPRRRCSRRATAGVALDETPPTGPCADRGRWRRLARRRRSRSRSGWSTRAGASSPRSTGHSAGEVWPLDRARSARGTSCARRCGSRRTCRAAATASGWSSTGRPGRWSRGRADGAPVGERVDARRAGAGRRRAGRPRHWSSRRSPDDRALDGLRLIGPSCPRGRSRRRLARRSTLHWRALGARPRSRPGRLGEAAWRSGRGRPRRPTRRLGGGLAARRALAGAGGRRGRAGEPGSRRRGRPVRWVGPEGGRAGPSAPRRGAAALLQGSRASCRSRARRPGARRSCCGSAPPS